MTYTYVIIPDALCTIETVMDPLLFYGPQSFIFSVALELAIVIVDVTEHTCELQLGS
jgi:hypothetical protein